MNKLTTTDMVRDAILGVLVSDASGMGLHWIYSQGKIAGIVKANDGVAEFLEPDASNYKGVPAFFAHPRRHAGEGSNYSEYIIVLLKAIGESGFDRGAYIRAFSEHFGVGGDYVGYADGPMRETIFNIAAKTKEIERTILEADTDLSGDRRQAAAHYIARYFFESDTEGVKAAIRNPLRLQEWSKEELEEADALVELVSRSIGQLGPDDNQMPALSRSAALPYFYDGEELDAVVELAVRVTNSNDEAVAASRFLARIMRDLYESGRPAPDDRSGTLRDIAGRHLPVLGDRLRTLAREAMAMDALDYRGATKRFGAACGVHMAVPLVLHLLLTTSSFQEANRVNILASGDNCGRAIMLGAVAGALYGLGGESGIPEEWVGRTVAVRRATETAGGRLLLR